MPDQLFAGESDHPTERVVGRDDPVVEVGEEHGRHVVLEGEAEALFGFANQRLVSREELAVAQALDTVGQLGRELTERLDLVRARSS